MAKNTATTLVSLVSELVGNNHFDKIVITNENKSKGDIRVELYRGNGKKALRKTVIVNLITNAAHVLLGYRSRVPLISGRGIPTWSGHKKTQPKNVVEAAAMNSLLEQLGITDVRVIPHEGTTTLGEVVRPKEK